MLAAPGEILADNGADCGFHEKDRNARPAGRTIGPCITQDDSWPNVARKAHQEGRLRDSKKVIDRWRISIYGQRNHIGRMTMKQTWQIRFKKKCIDMGMTSGEAAEKMGVSRSYLSEVLTGVPGNADEEKEGDASSRWAIPIAS
jgi:hypothetical protein